MVYLKKLNEKNVKWKVKSIDREKKLIKSELDSVSNNGKNLEKRMDHIQTRISEMENDDSPIGQLRLFIYIVSALVQHAGHSCLSDPQIRKYYVAAQAILLTQHINPEKSRLSGLFGDLHSVLGQIWRRQGDHWAAAWEHAIAQTLSSEAPKGNPGYFELLNANRMIRLGFSHRALFKLRFAEQTGLNQNSLLQGKLLKLKILRLLGNVQEATKLSTELHQSTLSDEAKKELEWEDICRSIPVTKDLTPMIKAVQFGKSHHQAIYLVEAYLWAKSVEREHWAKDLTLMRTVARNKDLDAKNLGLFFTNALTIEDCYEESLPELLRIRNLNEVLTDAKKLTTIDKELFCWAAAARWLASIKFYPLAILALSEYQNLCLKITEQKTNDILGAMGDLVKKPWFLREAL